MDARIRGYFFGNEEVNRDASHLGVARITALGPTDPWGGGLEPVPCHLPTVTCCGSVKWSVTNGEDTSRRIVVEGTSAMDHRCGLESCSTTAVTDAEQEATTNLRLEDNGETRLAHITGRAGGAPFRPGREQLDKVKELD